MFQPPHPAQTRGPGAATRWLAIVLLVVAAALVWAVISRRGPDQSRRESSAHAPIAEVAHEATPPVMPRPPTPPGSLTTDEQQTIQMFERTSPSVVHVTSIAVRRSPLDMNVLEIPQGTGSGFIWDNHGHIVTNYHVIKDGESAQVTLSDNSVWPAKIVGTMADKDVAVLEIDAPADKLPAIRIGTSADLKVGQTVLAIGNPFGLDQTLTTGVISGLNREIQSITRRPIQGVIQTDAAINPGNSGGPLLDSSGRLIGINTAIYSPSGAYAGVGFAVPIDTVNRIVPELIQHGKVVKPGLGILIVPDAVAARFGIDGVIVRDVPEGSPASSAGLRGPVPGNDGRWVLGDVIVGIDGGPVHDSRDMYRALDNHNVGDKIELEIDLRGERRKVTIELQAVPDR